MKKRVVTLLLSLLCVLTACVPAAQQEKENIYTLYYPVADLSAVAGADAVVPREIVIDGADAMDTEELSEALLRKLLGPVPDKEVVAPIRNGTTLKSVSIAGQWAQVDFSRAYASLAGLDLTLADYCVALTLTQLEGVNAITVTAEGNALPQRGERPLLASDALLSTTETRLTVTARLYFYDAQQNILRAERRALALYEGQTRIDALLTALLAGPEDESLQAILPEKFNILSARTEGNTCYLNLPYDTSLGEKKHLALSALVNSLCSLSNIEQVQVILDGEIAAELDGIPVAEPLSPGT